MLLPNLARSQQVVRRLAIVLPDVPGPLVEPLYQLFSAELSRLGFSEGRNLFVDRHFGNSQMSAYGELMRRAVAKSPDAIFTVGGTLSLEAKKATQTVPVVVLVADPIILKVASSLARPGSNITGVTVDGGLELYGKRLSLLLDLQSEIKRVGYLCSSRVLSRTGPALHSAAQKARVDIIDIDLGDTFEDVAYAKAFAQIADVGLDALVVSDEAEHPSHSEYLCAAAISTRLPVVFPYRSLAVAGGLMAYSVDFTELYKYAAHQVAEILRGRNPATTPFYQPTKFQLVINTRTAQRIGLTVPPSLLLHADEVIE